MKKLYVQNKNIPYGRQYIDEDDINSVIKVLKSDWITQGPAIDQFEKIIAEYCGAKYAIAVNSATSALHIACLASGLGNGDVLWTSPNTFVASANCGLYCGADVNFIDIELNTYNIDIDVFEKKLIQANKEGKLPKIVIPVHFAGQSCNMLKIAELANYYGFTVIEDASHAIGGSYLNSKIGSCTFSDMTVFSFHPVKIITTGEGGIITTNRKDLYEKLIRLRTHGITRNSEFMQTIPHGQWYYEQIELGFNYRMTDIQAALGISQLQKIDNFIKKRQFLANRYKQELHGLPVILPHQCHDVLSAYHLFVIRLKLSKITKSHRQIFDELRNSGIGVNLHYIPVYMQPYYQKLGFKKGTCPKAEQYYKEALSIPVYYDLSADDQSYVIQNLKEIIV